MFTVHRRKFTAVYCSQEEVYRCLLFIGGSLPVFTVHRRKFTGVYCSQEEVYRCLLITGGSLLGV